MKGRNIWLDGSMGLVVGDALGVPVEFDSGTYLEKRPVTGMQGHGTYDLPEGTWSGGSSMTLATLDSLKNGYDLKDIMDKLVLWLTRGAYTVSGENFDADNTCRKAVYAYCENGDVKTCGSREAMDCGSGSLVRMLPVCLYFYEKQKQEGITDDEVIDKIHEVSSLTHAHTVPKVSCGLYFFCVKGILDGEGTLQERLQKAMDEGGAYYPEKMPDMAADVIDDEYNHIEFYMQQRWECFCRLADLAELASCKKRYISTSGYVVGTLEAALWCLLNTDSYESCVLKAVNMGHNTDTVAAVTGGLAGLYYGYDAIPRDWLAVIKKREWIEGMCRMEK